MTEVPDNRKILAIDCTAKSVSVAVVSCDGNMEASSFLNNGLTHSQTLLPLLNSMLAQAEIALEQIDFFAVAAGPGSFTGVRIGVAAVKGMATALGKPCVSVSTLDAMAAYAAANPQIEEFANTHLCAVMDARCAQVYNAIFDLQVGSDAIKIVPDRAVAIAALTEDLQNCAKATLIGDGAELCLDVLKTELPNLQLAPENMRLQCAKGVAYAAIKKIKAGDVVAPQQLVPIYLRVPQAERELKKRRENGLN
ncbi:MAG: tRNA (adenosine(37)-N6)-threonylcarbamoyltransferase complex dimerization subunit type 1 TsaB [Oscillospiraceae bacterium]|jgi:tRNA threonylcarbamoyladenosine biosynthesis protein TsaB|nr:tRNA (adenosine(37)-N6)-threonylcarbamoyltransferase complex dimerization subunit type 1 TsaB [Oscillospiraceae bacterium]